MKILLIGANGQVGWECQRSFASLGKVIVLERQQLDLTDTQAIRDKIQHISPDIIVNATAYTAVDKAEQEPQLAAAINTLAPQVMAEEAVKLDIPLIHYSTDYVFDGEIGRAWTEEDKTNPQNVYGKTKLAGEQAIAATGAAYLILRTSWVYGARGNNFLRTMIRLATERDKVSVVNDQFGSPTWSRDLANATAEIMTQGIEQIADKSGVYHLTAAGKTSWYGFAQVIFEMLQQQGHNVAELTGIPSRDYPTPAARPAYSCLNNDKFKSAFNLQIPEWEGQVRLVMKSLADTD
jgi:dTDP-4-dehydrorhamnose reductase